MVNLIHRARNGFEIQASRFLDNLSLHYRSAIMNKAFPLLILCSLVGLILMPANVTSAQEDADVAAIKDRIGQYVAAVEAGDLDLYLDCWDEDGIQMPPDAPAVYGRENIGVATAEMFAQNAAAGIHFDMTVPDPEEVQILGDWAFGRGPYTVAVLSQEEEQIGFVDGKDLAIWKRQADGGWKLYIDCFNSNVPPGSPGPTTSIEALSWGAVKALMR